MYCPRHVTHSIFSTRIPIHRGETNSNSLAIKNKRQGMYSRQKKKKKTAIYVKMHLGEASTLYKAEVAAVRSLAPKTRYCHLKQRTKNRNRCLISQLEMKKENEDIFCNMARYFHLCPLVRKGSSFGIHLFIWLEKKSRNIINLSEKEKNLHFSDKTLYTSKSPE